MKFDGRNRPDSPQRVLVFAAGSFLGIHLCHELMSSSMRIFRTSLPPNLLPESYCCDITDREQVDRIVADVRPTLVFQLAGGTRTNDPHLLYRIHIEGTLNLLSSIKAHVPDALLVLMGSAAEYGNVDPGNIPVSEEQIPNPNTFFGSSKLAQTHIAQVAAYDWGLRIVSTRPFNIIGPGIPEH